MRRTEMPFTLLLSLSEIDIFNLLMLVCIFSHFGEDVFLYDNYCLVLFAIIILYLNCSITFISYILWYNVLHC